MRDVLLSVGIDIGTSTTQIIFSNITIEDMSSGFSVPRIEIIDKEIVYRSDIYFTPLISATEIDMAKVRDIVDSEYKKMGVEKGAIKTGAVVITGETARKRNANEVLLHLSEFAGDFVVATAGPDLESIIAARGAGADLYSRKHHATAANYDIGGGTSNFAMFNDGELVSTSCLDIGGRLIKIDDNKQISYIAPKIEELCRYKNIPVKLGDRADAGVLMEVTRAMCELLEMSLGLLPKNSFYPSILTDKDHDLELPVPLQHICFSGGVADYIYSHDEQDDPFRFGDIGVLLGRTIRNSPVMAGLDRFKASETIRATVVGAGTHITEISGSTIEYDPQLLPLKNLPILKLTKDEEATTDLMAEAIRKKLDWFRLDGELQNVAVAFNGPHSPSFQMVNDLADAILSAMDPLIKEGFPLVTVSENDMAKALGQTIRAKIDDHKGFICIDAVAVTQGDYIDIGSPAAGGSVLPVVIKTLLFK